MSVRAEDHRPWSGCGLSRSVEAAGHLKAGEALQRDGFDRVTLTFNLLMDGGAGRGAWRVGPKAGGDADLTPNFLSPDQATPPQISAGRTRSGQSVDSSSPRDAGLPRRLDARRAAPRTAAVSRRTPPTLVMRCLLARFAALVMAQVLPPEAALRPAKRFRNSARFSRVIGSTLMWTAARPTTGKECWSPRQRASSMPTASKP